MTLLKRPKIVWVSSFLM